jgi:hypothetical protein
MLDARPRASDNNEFVDGKVGYERISKPGSQPSAIARADYRDVQKTGVLKAHAALCQLQTSQPLADQAHYVKRRFARFFFL